MDSSDSSKSDTPKTDPSPRRSEELKGFTEQLDAFKTSEEKIAFGLSFMRETISQEGTARFKEFWDSRLIVLPLFKGNINSIARSKFWDEYIELTQEARRLKEVLEEQSSFELEQIDLAIGAIEREINELDPHFRAGDGIKLSDVPYSLKKRTEPYEKSQKELSLLNSLATRLNGLRREVSKTNMRIRFKTKFFKRLSQVGDLVFPRRKKEIEEISKLFKTDVDHFISKHFKGEEIVGAPYYALREEIKAFQAMAKSLTLNSSTFSSTRLSLSDCWDKIKVLDREHKKELIEKKEASAEAFKAIEEKVEGLKERAKDLSLKELDGEIEAISTEMRAIYIDRDDQRILKQSFEEMRSPHIEIEKNRVRELEEAAKKKLLIKKERVLALQKRISSLAESCEMPLEEIEKEFKALEVEIASLELSNVEKKQVRRQLVPLRDLITDKKESSILNLSDNDLETLKNYQIVLKAKKERRALIKEQIDLSRKALGASSLDFEKSFHLSQELEAHRERLEKASESIEEIEGKISELES